MEKFSDSSLPHSEFLYIAHGLSSTNKVLDNSTDEDINLSDFMPEPKSLSQILRLSPAIKEKWGSAISGEIQGLFENDTFDPNQLMASNCLNSIIKMFHCGFSIKSSYNTPT